MVTGGLVEEEEEEEEFQVLQEQFWLEVAAAIILPCSLVASMNNLLTLLVAMAACPDWLWLTVTASPSQPSFNLSLPLHGPAPWCSSSQ